MDAWIKCRCITNKTDCVETVIAVMDNKVQVLRA